LLQVLVVPCLSPPNPYQHIDPSLLADHANME